MLTKRILLTGSSGFLGQHTLFSLLTTAPPTNTQYEILALHGKSSSGFAQAVHAIPTHERVHVTVESLDLSQPSLEDVLKSWNQPMFDICLHTAAMSSPRTCEAQPDQARAINNPKAFFNALHRLNPNIRIIALSTDQVYPGTSPPYLETDPTKALNVYARTKLEMETTLSKMPAVCLRSSIILGPALAPILPEAAHSSFLQFVASRQGQTTDFFTDECRSVVAVDHVVNILQWFLQHGQTTSGIYNMGGPHRVSRMDMAQAVFDHLGYDTSVLVAKKKADLPAAGVQSPLDIAMDSRKLSELTGLSSGKTLQEMIVDFLPKSASS